MHTAGRRLRATIAGAPHCGGTPRRGAAIAVAVAAVLVTATTRRVRNRRRAERHSGADATPGFPGGTDPAAMRILHLGFEDHHAPGAGGGSLRTHEINRRLAARGHTVVVLTTRFPGCHTRVDDGVRYQHVGIGSGRTRLSRLIGYVLLLPLAASRVSADLVVEDFFAPISSMAVPRWDGRPTIAVVQWLNARDKARQYKVPVHIIERFGVRSHTRFIAVSNGIADEIRTMNPGAAVDVIANGVDATAFDVAEQIGDGVLFVGRLEIAQKGLDLLLQSWACSGIDDSATLQIAGTGPDEDRLRRLAVSLGIADQVQFVGWVGGREKYELMAAARLVVVPSRFETFGIVAVEALAAATPVLAFDIPCLREVVPAAAGWLVPAFDVEAFATALSTGYRDTGRLAAAGAAGRRFAAGYDWDTLAGKQEQAYRDAPPLATTPVARAPRRRSTRNPR